MTEENLMNQVKHGDLDKVALIYDNYQRRLYNFFVKMCGDRDVAGDMTQNVFLRLIKYRHTYREEAKFQSWIFQMARNVMNDHFRKNNIHYLDYEEVKLTNTDDSILTTMENEEQHQQLNRALQALKPEQRELIILSRFQKMKYEEIANIMGLSVANVKVRVHRTIKQLKDNYLKLEEG